MAWLASRREPEGADFVRTALERLTRQVIEAAAARQVGARRYECTEQQREGRLTCRLREDVDFQVPRGLERFLLRTLAEMRWIAQHQNARRAGPCDVGKTYVA